MKPDEVNPGDTGGRISNRKAYAQLFENLCRGRIKQCSGCEQTQIQRGLLHAFEKGWRFTIGVGRLVWLCGTCATAAPQAGCSRDIRIENVAGAGGSSSSSSSSGTSSSSSSSSGPQYCISSLNPCLGSDGIPCKTNLALPSDDGKCFGGSCCRGGQ
jgi:hypothetical protein